MRFTRGIRSGLGAKWFLLCVSVYLVGCAGGYRVQTSVEADGTVIDRMVDNEVGLEGEGEYSDYAIQGSQMDLAEAERQCFLDASRHRAPDGEVTYYLLFSYTGPRHLEIAKRRSMELFIDEHTSLTLRGRGQVTRDENKMENTFSESYDYEISDEVLVRLANANEVKVVVKGSEFDLDCYFVDRNFENFRKFVKEFVDWVD